jgi:hypothetical protein
MLLVFCEVENPAVQLSNTAVEKSISPPRYRRRAAGVCYKVGLEPDALSFPIRPGKQQDQIPNLLRKTGENWNLSPGEVMPGGFHRRTVQRVSNLSNFSCRVGPRFA